VKKMCLSIYDLVCDRCRQKHDEIFGKLNAKGDCTLEEEEKAREKWFNILCKECREDMRNEGFIP